MRYLVAAIVMVSTLLAAAWAEDPVGSIDYTDGPFTLTRGGTAVVGPSIGDDVYDQDIIATGAGGTVTLALAKATGMTGTITISPSSSFYVEVDGQSGQQHTQIELISGDVGLKVKKLSGSPTLSVASDTSTMGVRGTEFDVTTSDDGNLLVTCSEGEVACTDEDGSVVSAVPGQTVEKREGQRMQRRALALAEYRSYRQKWAADESAAFRRNAPRTVRLIAVRYLELAAAFQSIQEELASNGILKRWLEEERSGATGPSPELAAQLAQVGPRLKEAKRLLGAMMRITARVEALDRVLQNDRAARANPVRKGLTVADFFARFSSQRSANERRQVWLMHAVKLFRRHLAVQRAASGS